MTGVIATNPKFQFSNATGTPLANGTLTTYLAGTTTLATTWQDSALTAANTNPIVLDSRGECVIYLDPTKNYKFVLKNSAAVTQWTQDNVNGGGSLADRLRTDLAASSGASLVGYMPEGSGAVPRTVQDKSRESVSVLDFYANGVSGARVDLTGVVDSTLGIQAAINSLSSGEVLIPVGSFLSGPLTLKSNVSLVGQGPSSKLIVKTASTDFLIGTSVSNIHLRDFHIDCSLQISGTGCGMKITGLTDSSIRGVEVYNAAAFGWLIFSAVRCSFIGNTIDTTRLWDGMTITTGSTDCVISGNIVRNSCDSGIGITDTDNMSVTGNIVDRVKVGGSWFAPGIDAAGARNAVISGNFVRGNQFGISALLHPNSGQYPKRVTVTGNTIGDGTYGVMIGYAVPSIGPFGTLQEITVSGNTIYNQDTQGIHCDTTTNAIVISGNSVSYGGGDGINFTSCNGVAILGNHIANNGGNGIVIGAANTDITMIGNVSKNNTVTDYTGSQAGLYTAFNRNTSGFAHAYCNNTNIILGGLNGNNTVGSNFGGGIDTIGKNGWFVWPEADGQTQGKVTSRVISTGSAYHAFFANSNGVVGDIHTNGTTTAYATSSDYRLKTNITPMTNSLATVSLLKPVDYKWKIDGSSGQGFIAHELQAVIPDCVAGEKDGVDADGNPKYQSVDTSFLVATLTAAIQELDEKFEAYKAAHP